MFCGPDNLKRWAACLVAAALLSAGWVRPQCTCYHTRLQPASHVPTTKAAPPPCCAGHAVADHESTGHSHGKSDTCCPCGCPGNCPATCSLAPLVYPLAPQSDASCFNPADAGRVIHARQNDPPAGVADEIFHPPRS
ncbi:MAG: hypothetical protein PVJ57_02600 [Phycisphaerae bacterium]